MTSAAPPHIALSANTAADTRYLSGILTDAGFVVETIAQALHTRSTRLETAIVLGIRTGGHCLCHRGETCTLSEVVNDTSGAARLVVFSDALNERCIVNALEAGAHHVFPLDETPRLTRARLLAAFRALIESRPRRLNCGPFDFDLQRRVVQRDQQPLNLSPKEYDLALYLFQNTSRIVSRAELLSQIWSLPPDMDSRRIDTAACRVRRKMQIGESSEDWQLLRVRGVGYRLMSLASPQQDAVPQPHSDTAKPARDHTATPNALRENADSATMALLDQN